MAREAGERGRAPAFFPRPINQLKKEGRDTSTRSAYRNEMRNTTGMSFLEKTVLVLVLLILVAVAVPLILRFTAEMQLKENRINLRDLREEALTRVQTGLGDMDSTDPVGRHLGEGLGDGAGWVAVAQFDGNNNMIDVKIYVVDDIDAYRDGIAPGRVTQPVPLGSDVTFYEAPESDNIRDPFATVKPTSGGNEVYTVQVVIDNHNVDLVPV